MALPANLSTVTLSGTYIDLQGNPIRGQVKFTPRTVASDADADTIIIPSAVTISLDDNGSFVTVLPATDDANLNPINFSYKVEESFTGGRTFDITLPTALGSVNLADLVPALPNDGSGGLYVTQAEYTAMDVRVDALELTGNLFTTTTTAATNALAAANSAASTASAAAANTTAIQTQASNVLSPLLLFGS